MPYFFQEFLNDKREFFALNADVAEVKTRVKEKNYTFLVNNRLLIEQEFDHILNSLKNKGEDREKFWLYCYYCSLMLQSYYSAYGKTPEADKYRNFSDAILNRGKEKPPLQASFWQNLQKQIKTDLGKLVSTPLHTSKIRDWVAFANITRLQVVFCRITVQQSLLALKDLKWLESLETMLGRHIDVDGMVSVLNTPANIFNALSVGLFATRFIINAGTILKHCIFPSTAEKTLSLTDFFSAELNKRHVVFINDLVWASVNGVTNYAKYFNVSASAANWILSGFLLFDVALFLYGRHLEEHDYRNKKEQYLNELTHHVQANDERNMLNEQLAQLERSWQVTNATCWFNVTAATLLIMGFSASFLLTHTAAAPIGFFVGSVAIAMYISKDMYSTYHKKSLIVQVQTNHQDIEKESAAMVSARNNLILSITKNTLMPMFLLTTAAVSLPAALLLTLSYLGYECGKGYFDKPEVPALALGLA